MRKVNLFYLKSKTTVKFFLRMNDEVKKKSLSCFINKQLIKATLKVQLKSSKIISSCRASQHMQVQGDDRNKSSIHQIFPDTKTEKLYSKNQAKYDNQRPAL